VRQEPRRLRGRRAHADRHRDRTEAPERIEHGDQRGLVRGRHAHVLPGADAAPREPAGEVVGRRGELAPRDASVGEHEAAGRAAPLALQAKERGRRRQERRHRSGL